MYLQTTKAFSSWIRIITAFEKKKVNYLSWIKSQRKIMYYYQRIDYVIMKEQITLKNYYLCFKRNVLCAKILSTFLTDESQYKKLLEN